MDILSQAVSDTATIHVKSAAGEPLYSDGKPVRITIYGRGSKQYAVVEARQTARAIKRMHDNDGKITAATPEERVQETAEDLADLTATFENIEYGELQGQELFRAVYAEPRLGFIVDQMTRVLKDWGNFKPGSAGN